MLPGGRLHIIGEMIMVGSGMLLDSFVMLRKQDDSVGNQEPLFTTKG